MKLTAFLHPNRQREQIVSRDLGSLTTKAVLLQRSGGQMTLARYTIQDAPIYEKTLSPALLSEHLRAVVQALEPKTKQITLAVGAAESLLRRTEMPLIPLGEMRQMVKLNSKNYLQQDLPDHVFDCFILPPKQVAKPEVGKVATPKFKVWVVGAKIQLVSDIQNAVRSAGLIADQIAPSMLGPVNAFELAQPELYNKDVVALVDVGFRHSTINILFEGELVLSRVVAMGGDRLTSGLAEAMAISYAEAEGLKVGMPTEVETHLQPLLAPLGQELRASINFFEHEHDKTVAEVYISGGAARSDFIVQMLQAELMVSCKAWNPLSHLQLALPPNQMTEVDQVATQLTVAIGAAASVN